MIADEDGLTKAKTLFKLIQELDITKESLSDPAKMHHLPFPFPHVVPEDRFSLDQENKFAYMGRSVLPKLCEEIERQTTQDKILPINVYGTKGYGKSHIIAATVLLMIKEKKQRVLFLPQARDMAAKGTTEYLRRAALLTFADDDNITSDLLDCATSDDLVRLLKAQLFILVSDQMNSLEEDLKLNAEDKSPVRSVIKSLGEKVLHIRGFSANNDTAKVFATTQRSEIDLPWFGGFSKVGTSLFLFSCCSVV